MFTMLSTWQSHCECESSPRWPGECRIS